MDNQHMRDEADPTDADLARAWSAGDERAYDAIVVRYAPLVYNRCRRVLGDTDADDATQAVFLVLAQKRDQAAASPVLAAWLMTVAGNVVRNAWRDRQRRRSAETSVPPPPPPSAVEPTMHGIQDHLDACLAKLPAQEREAVMLHHLAGHTLAEVGKQTGSGLSTVRYRIERGLERLRTLLTARGVSLSSVALVAILASEAQAAVPAHVLAHLHELAPAGGGAGSTAVPSDRVQRWSRQRSSTMTRIAITAAGLLLAGGAILHYLPSSEAPPALAKPVVPAPAPAFTPIGNPLLDLDPERARTWIVIRANDGARTVERLRGQPEMALLPAGQAGWLDDLASLREAVVVIDQDSLLSGPERIGSYRLEQKAAGMTHAQRLELAQAEVRRLAAQDEGSDADGKIPAFSGWIAGRTSTAPLFGRLRSTLGAAQAVPGVRPAGNGWDFTTVAGDGHVAITGDRIAITAPQAAVQLPAAIAALVGRPALPAADLEFVAYLDPGRPGLAPSRMTTGSLRLGAEGLRFTSTSEIGFATPPGPVLDHRRFEDVPAAAILAGAVAMHPGEYGGAYFQTMITSITQPMERLNGGTLPPELQAALKAISLLLDRTDGVILAWLEPGMPIPSLTLQADLSQADAHAIIAATGLPRAADGTATTMAGPVMISLGWSGGRLTVTTNPAGLDGVDRKGGFTSHPEIQRALAAMPQGGINACALVRPAAALDLAIPFGAMLVPDLQKPLIDYRAALVKNHGYGYLTSATDGTRMTVDAGGALALVGCAILANQAADPAARVRIAN